MSSISFLLLKKKIDKLFYIFCCKMYKKFYKILLGYMSVGERGHLKTIGLIEDTYALVAESPGFNYQDCHVLGL